MTDDQIRAWLDLVPSSHNPPPTEQEIDDCLTELLQHRHLHRSIKWAVWLRDQSAESGWVMLAAFPDWDAAETYRNVEQHMSGKEYLVLPLGEVPALTAR